MRGKVLFFYPIRNYVSPTSGEIEARCLFYGAQLAGYDADVLGFEASGFNSYDLFIVFGCSAESIGYIPRFPRNSRIIVIPYLDDLSVFPAQEILQLEEFNIWIYARSKEEYSVLESKHGIKQTLLGKQWFIAPFCFITNGKFDPKPIDDVDVLIMSEPDRIGIIPEFPGRNTLVLSDVPEQYWLLNHPNLNSENIDFSKRIKYGTPLWYYTLSSAAYLFESNRRITASLLEKLWLGGKVIVSSDSPILEELSSSIHADKIDSSFTSISLVNRKAIILYHADYVARAFFHDKNRNE